MKVNEELIEYCKVEKLQFETGYDWCGCNDFGEFINVKVAGKWHTLYCLNNGGYRFDKSIVETLDQIKELLNA